MILQSYESTNLSKKKQVPKSTGYLAPKEQIFKFPKTMAEEPQESYHKDIFSRDHELICHRGPLIQLLRKE